MPSSDRWGFPEGERSMRRVILVMWLVGSGAVADAEEMARFDLGGRWLSIAQGQPAPVPGSPSGPEPPPALLEPVIVTAPPPAAASSEQLIPGRDFELRPQGRPADILRLVPGLIIGQHQGGGKSEQYILRGFDADHGADVALFVDGLPINLRSHAHGQGYADQHFVIPETLKQVDVYKGPYYVEFGDFATAGAINFVTLDAVPENLVSVAGGNWGTQRHLTLLSPTRERVKTLLAAEVYTTDGPFDRPQNYIRLNLFGKATASLGETVDATAWVSYLDSNWFASGQIPARAVRARLIDRFGAIDNSEGGNTQRLSANAHLRWQPSEASALRVHAYGQYYQLDLFSNFTFFLEDPVNGDQIVQSDRNRIVAGLDTSYEHRGSLFQVPLVSTAGFQFRLDRPRIVLGNSADRHLLVRTQDASIFQQSYSPFVKLDAAPLPWLRFITGARGDIFHYRVTDNLEGAPDQPDGTATRAIPSAKANLILGPWRDTELYANFGTGFHSNDARAVVAQPELPALAQATGWELGVRTRVLPRVELFATYWWLNLSSELVFNGDSGTTEPSGASRRQGLEVGLKVRPLDWLTFTGNVTYTPIAEFFNGNAIPLAPRVTALADATVRLPWGLSASATMRYIGNRWADEERQQTARGYTLLDLGARYRYTITPALALDAFVSIENVADVDWREAQFFFTSRLRGEAAEGVPDIHYTPGNPRTVLGGLALRF
jgi:outer membrane receptor protein involved in Fe transport